MNTKEALDYIINRYNANPMNSEKFYYKLKDVEYEDESYFELTFGVSKNNSLILRQNYSKSEKELGLKRIYEEFLDLILGVIYDTIDRYDL